ncbi:MAG TPA: hypothetical protein VE863_12520 [Pyrinomonadaceae bacterium]|nr:hypothetical protein [Pyrinomonadaceae bacterium]
MKTFSRFLFAVLAFGFFLGLVSNANGCSCQDFYVPVCAEYWRADAVFVGYVKTITEPNERSDNVARLHLIVEQPLRGITEAEVDVLTAWKTSCDIGFKVGERWLIYAYRNEDTQMLGAGACSSTKRFEDAEEDLSYARSVSESRAGQSIVGSIVENMWTPLSGMKVALESADRKLETVTDEYGGFDFRDLRPGKYSIRAYVPFAADLENETEQGVEVKSTDEQSAFNYQVDLTDGRCQYRQLDLFRVNLHATAQASGQVLQKSGQPLASGYLYLVNAEDNRDRYLGEIDKSGDFKIGQLPPGRYFLVMNPDDDAPDGNNVPYARRYYPGVSRVKEATPITLTEGAKLEHLDLRLPAPLKERLLTGTVKWTDGRPAADAYVWIRLAETRKSVRMVRTDETGKFSVPIYGDFKYEIEAESEAESDRHGRGEKVRVSDGDRLRRFKLVIKSEPYN